jgi:hypothetical protein
MKSRSILEKVKFNSGLPWCVMPIPLKKTLMFGDLITAVYDACGKRRARGILRHAVNAHQVAFRGPFRYQIA